MNTFEIFVATIVQVVLIIVAFTMAVIIPNTPLKMMTMLNCVLYSFLKHYYQNMIQMNSLVADPFSSATNIISYTLFYTFLAGCICIFFPTISGIIVNAVLIYVNYILYMANPNIN
jgi:hypothetical protein